MNSSANIRSAPELSILMPVYNEVGNIAKIIDLVKAALPGVTKEIVIVDDGSTDGTRNWLSENFQVHSEEEPRGQTSSTDAASDGCAIRVIFHSRNKGKGGAIQSALRAATGAVLVIQD